MQLYTEKPGREAVQTHSKSKTVQGIRPIRYHFVLCASIVCTDNCGDRDGDCSTAVQYLHLAFNFEQSLSFPWITFLDRFNQINKTKQKEQKPMVHDVQILYKRMKKNETNITGIGNGGGGGICSQNLGKNFPANIV